MVVWGGYDGTTDVDTGGRYDPLQDRWLATSTSGAPQGRSYHSFAWIGNRMVVWGGSSGALDNLNTGGRYDPSTDTWTATTLGGGPSARWHHTGVWTGSLMIVWGTSGRPRAGVLHDDTSRR